MNTIRETLDRLDEEHAALGQALALRWWHWSILLLSFAVSIYSWQVASRFAAERARVRFEHEAGTVADTLAYRLERLERRADATPPPDASAPAAATFPSSAAVAGLMHGVLDPERRLVGLALEEGARTIYADERPTDASYSSRRAVGRADRELTVRLWSTPELERRMRRYLPHAVLIGVLLLDALLFALFLGQARGARRTLRHARDASLLSGDLERTAAELKQINGELERFACVVSHDLKAPVQGTACLLDILAMDLEEECEPEVRRLLGPNVAGARRKTADMQRLIDSILTSSAVAARTRAPDGIDTGELVRGIGRALPIRDAQLIVDDDMPRVHTDGTRLHQVLANLIQNAFRYHHDPTRARVEVSARVVDAMVRFRVADDGPGIAPEHHARVFEPFESLAENARAGSTGIGLSIVREAVAAVGGELRLDSAVGRGATFEFTWPP